MVVRFIGGNAPAPADKEAQLAADATGDLWQPKPESALSAYLAHELTLRLRGRGVAVNREVLIKPSNAYGAGERTDIKAEATPCPLTSRT